MSSDNTIRIALAGNPNCGKTTIFNNITGAKQHVTTRVLRLKKRKATVFMTVKTFSSSICPARTA